MSVKYGRLNGIVDMDTYATDHWDESIAAAESILASPLAAIALRDELTLKFRGSLQVRRNKRVYM
jgi:hypothetical protein